MENNLDQSENINNLSFQDFNDDSEYHAPVETSSFAPEGILKNLDITSINKMLSILNKNKNQSLNSSKIEGINDKFENLNLSKNTSEVALSSKKSNSTNNVTGKNANLGQNNRSCSTKNVNRDRIETTNNESITSRNKSTMGKTSSQKDVKPGSKRTKKSNLEVKGVVDSMVSRFKEKQIITMKKIEEMKKKIEEQELANLRSTPEINKTKYNLEGEDFFKRMQIKQNNLDNKKKQLAERELQKIRESSKLNPKLNQKLSEDQVKGKINSMMKWENERRDKIKSKKLEEESKQLEECTFQPKINSNSKKIAQMQQELYGDSKGNVNQKENITKSQLYQFYENLKSNNFALEHNNVTEIDHKIKELERNLMKANNDESTSIKSNQKSFQEERNNIGFTPTTMNSLNDVTFNLNPKFLENISAKESKIIEELLRQRMNFK